MDPAETQKTLLRELLGQHPRLVETSALCEQFKQLPHVEPALRVLIDDGLAVRLGDLVGASRAAIRFEALRG